MAQNLIRLKQLNTTELSGFFASAATNTGAFASLFGPQIVYTTGDQTLSGTKTFANRPTVNGTGFLLSGEVLTLPTTIVYTTGDQTLSGSKTFASRPNVNGTGVLLSGQNVFVLQGGTTQSTTSIGDNYIALAGAHIGWSNTTASRRVAILENCVARKASIILHQDATGPTVSNITGSLINITQGLTGIISQSMATNNNNNFTNYSNSNLNVPFSAGDNAVILIHSQSAIANVRGMANVYFYN